MIIKLNSCSAARPDKRALISMLVEIADDIDQSLAQESIDILLEGDPVEIKVSFNESTAFRKLRKLDVDYTILD